MVTIAIIGVLAGVVLIAIDPAKQIQRAGDAGRKSDISQIAGALEAYSVSHNGVYIAGVTNSLAAPEGAASAAGATWDTTLETSGEIKKVRDQATVYDSVGAATLPSIFKVYRLLAATQLAWGEGFNDYTVSNQLSSTTCNAAFGGIATSAVYYVYDTIVGKPYWHCNSLGSAPAVI